MNITEVRIFPKESDDKKLRAFATVTFDSCFVVRDIKVIEGSKGFFVAMPSRRVKEPCLRCRHRVTVGSRYCSHCGASLESSHAHKPGQGSLDVQGRQNGHRDIAHPITAAFREVVQEAVLDAYDRDRANPRSHSSSAFGESNNPT